MIVPGAGARELLECLPRDIWAVVTSTNRSLAETRMHLAGLPKAPLLVAAEDVQARKAAPMVTGSPPKNLGWIAKERSCSKIQTPYFGGPERRLPGDCRHGDPRYAGPRSNRLD